MTTTSAVLLSTAVTELKACLISSARGIEEEEFRKGWMRLAVMDGDVLHSIQPSKSHGFFLLLLRDHNSRGKDRDPSGPGWSTEGRL